MKNYAYVTFVMNNDSFIPGALVFAYALKKQATKADLVCLVTEEVSPQAITSLKQLYDKVIKVKRVYVPHTDRQTRQDRPFLFTRFQALRLGKDGDLGCHYDKIILADADVLPLCYYDTLFDIKTPSGIINEKKEYCMEYQEGKYIIPDSVYQDGTWIWHKVYESYPSGSLIPAQVTNRVLSDKQNMGVNASLYGLTPNMSLYKAIIEDSLNRDIQKIVATFPWPEMQYITYKLSGKWHNIDLKYSSFNGYPIIDVLFGIHYAGLKPWRRNHRSIKHFGLNEDYRLWYAVYKKMIHDYPKLQENTVLKKLNQFIDELWQDSRYHFTRRSLPNLDHLFKD